MSTEMTTAMITWLSVSIASAHMPTMPIAARQQNANDRQRPAPGHHEAQERHRSGQVPPRHTDQQVVERNQGVRDERVADPLGEPA